MLVATDHAVLRLTKVAMLRGTIAAMAKRDPKLEDHFYAAKIPALARKLCTEQLTYAGQMEDLVDAHLKPNYQYFGSLDKTLAGFYILDATGDDYTLLDLRDDVAQIYFQEHDAEVREVKVRWASLSDYTHKKRTGKDRASRDPSTARLWRRYLWISVLLSQSKTEAEEADAIQTAVSFFLTRCKRDEQAFIDAFERERAKLAQDPHLAIYWLLHFTLTCDDERRALVVESVRRCGAPLVRAFVARFGAMKPTDTLSVLPSFRRRRAWFAFQVAAASAKEPFQKLARAYEMDDQIVSLQRAMALVTAAKTDADQARLTEIARRAKGTRPAPTYLRAAVLSSMKDAALFARHTEKAKPEELQLYGEGLPRIAKLVLDRKLLASARRALLATDPYNRAYLLLGDGKPDRRLAELDALATLAEGLRKDATLYAKVEALPRALKDRLAQEIVGQPGKYPLLVLRDAVLHVFKHAGRFLVLDDAMKWLEKRVKAGDEGARDVLWAFVVTNDRLRKQNDVEFLRRWSLRLLGPALDAEPLFSRVLSALDAGGALPAQLLREHFLDTRRIRRLSPAQRKKLEGTIKRLRAPSSMVKKRWGPAVLEMLA